MSVRIRLQRHGRKQRPFYHIVVADSRSPRDGRFIEKIGSYNPMTKPATIELDNDKAFDWLMNGASPSDTARAILKFKGVLYRKHLARGVQKGAMSQEKAEEMYTAFINEKEAKVQSRIEATAQEREAFLKAVSGTAAPIKVEEPEEEVVESAEEVSAEEGAETEAPTEDTPVAEAEVSEEETLAAEEETTEEASDEEEK